MGQMIFTCHFLCFENKLYPAIWTRLALNGYQFSKSNRKLLRRNNERFQVVIRPAVFDQEKEDLYQKHISRFQGYVAPTLQDSLFGEAEHNIYNTYEINVYDGSQLVAASFFDLGEKTMASIMGLFDPAYHKYSLGYFTMLHEIDFSLRNKFDYYYPGYVVPGYKKFDYKLRVGAMEYFEPKESTWKDYNSHFQKDDSLSSEMHQALDQLKAVLDQKNIKSKKILYPLYDKKLYGLNEEETIYNPLFLYCGSSFEQFNMLIIEYDIFHHQYHLSEVFKVDDSSLMIHNMFKGYNQEESCLNFLIREQKYGVYDNAEDISNVLLNGFRAGMFHNC